MYGGPDDDFPTSSHSSTSSIPSASPATPRIPRGKTSPNGKSPDDHEWDVLRTLYPEGHPNRWIIDTLEQDAYIDVCRHPRLTEETILEINRDIKEKTTLTYEIWGDQPNEPFGNLELQLVHI